MRRSYYPDCPSGEYVNAIFFLATGRWGTALLLSGRVWRPINKLAIPFFGFYNNA
jgi:hypothetical protein